MANNATPGSSKQAAREGARKNAVQKVARERRTRAPAAGKGKAKKRQRVESSDEDSGTEDAPPRKKGKKVTSSQIFDAEGVVIVGDEEGDEGGDGDGEENDAELDIPDGELDDAQLIHKLSERWRSSVYAFFKAEVTIEVVDGRRALTFRCAAKHCRIGSPVRRYLDKADRSSSGNLLKHARTCWGSEAVAQAKELGDPTRVRTTLVANILQNGCITEYFAPARRSVTYSNRPLSRLQIRFEFVRWVSESFRPFAVATDPGFLRLMKTGRPGMYIPSPTTISRDVKITLAGGRLRLAVMLRAYPGRLHFATDAWTSPNHRAFVAFTVHLEVDGTNLSILLDIIELAKSHTGVNLARAFVDVLSDMALDEKIMNVTCDNAANNDTMIEEMSRLLPFFEGQFHRVRCFAHVVNLVARSLLRQFDAKTVGEAEGEVDEDVRALLKLAESMADEDAETLAARRDEEGDDRGFEDDEEWVDEVATLSEEERADFLEQVVPVKLVLAKVRKLAFKVVNSSTILLPAWYDLCRLLKMPEKLVPRDVKTRWNSTFDMAITTVEYKEVYKRITADGELGLRGYELSRREWVILEQLRDVLKIFKDATLFFSRGSPTIAAVIPAMDLIDNTLTDAARENNKDLDPAIRTAAGIAKRTLNRYYKMSDMSATYRIAMVLHPRHKARYFERAGWPKSWVKEALDMLREEYDAHYRHLDVRDDEDDEDTPAGDDEQAEHVEDINKLAPTRSSAVKNVSGLAKHINVFDLMEAEDGPQAAGKGDALEEYLATPPEACSDPVKYWSLRKGSTPGLARMGIDYSTIPATSVDVERTFSKGRLILSHVRSRLSAQTTRALLCVGEWSRLSLLREEDVKPAVELPDVEGEEEYEMEEGWELVRNALQARK